MRKIAACVVLSLAAGFLCGQPMPPQPLTFPPVEGECQVLVIRNHDGDTITFAYLVQGTGRLYGINAPELGGATKEAGQASKDALAKLLPTGPTRAVLKGREKYGRTLIQIFTADGKDVSQLMIDGGFAKKWDGKGPRP